MVVSLELYSNGVLCVNIDLFNCEWKETREKKRSQPILLVVISQMSAEINSNVLPMRVDRIICISTDILNEILSQDFSTTSGFCTRQEMHNVWQIVESSSIRHPNWWRSPSEEKMASRMTFNNSYVCVVFKRGIHQTDGKKCAKHRNKPLHNTQHTQGLRESETMRGERGMEITHNCS